MKRSIQSGAGARLKQIRESLNMTQAQMAEILELSDRYLAQIESGTRNMSTTTLYIACERLSISADYLFLGRQKKESDTNAVIEMLQNIDEEYIPLAEDLLKTFLLAVNRSKGK